MLSSEQMQLASDLWTSIGLEIVIFLVTLACALALRALSPKPGKRPVQQKTVSSDPSEAPSASSSQRRKCEPSPKSEPDADAELPSRCQPAAVLDEAMECLREWQGGAGRPASRVLALYSELRQVLRASGKNLAEVAAHSRHRPCEFYLGLVQLVIRTGKHNLLNMIIDDMVQQRVPRSLAFYESAMKQLAVQKKFKLALAVYDRLVQDGLETSAITCSCLVRFAAEVGDLQRAKEFFEKLASMTTPSIRAYMTILGVHNKRQDWASALDTIRNMKKRRVQVDSLALNVALSTGVLVGKVSEVEELLSEAEEMKPFVPDVVSYNTVLKAYSQQAKYAEGREFLERMRKNRVQPNAITYNTVMDAAVRAGKPQEAWKRLQEMRDHGFKPDKFTCSILVKSLTKSEASLQEGTVDRALALLEETDKCLDMTLRTTLYNAVADVMAKAEFNESLLKVLSQMQRKGVVAATTLQKSMVQALRQDGM